MERKDKIFFAIVILCILLITGLLMFMISSTAQCVKNPFVYGANRIGEVECSCQSYQNPSCPAHFSFNETTLHFYETKCNGLGLTAPRQSIDPYLLP